MRVSRLEVHGFKSFASPAWLEFGDGITAVVGPNGSGKSNLVDAIRLVLGGAGARELRGQRLEQVIFSGGDRRAPLGMAEVTVVFDNEDGRIPVEEVEVALTRRVFRDGASEFRRNGRRIRLRDLGRLLDATGLAQAGYAIIAQNDIESIIRATPTQRRHLIEEAAGVRGTQLLLDDSRRRIQELDRWLEGSVGRLAELMPRLEELREQARRADQARELKERLQRLRGSLERAAWLAELANLRQLERQLDLMRRRRESAARAFADFDSHYRLERQRLELVEAGRLERERASGRLALRVQRAEAALERWRERAQQAAVTLAEARAQMEEVRADLRALADFVDGDPLDGGNAMEARRARVAELAGELLALEARRRELSPQITEHERRERDLGLELAANLKGQAERGASIQAVSSHSDQAAALVREVEADITGSRAELAEAVELAREATERARQQREELDQAVRQEASALEVLRASEGEAIQIAAQERASAAAVAAQEALLEERRRGRPIAEAAARGEVRLQPLSVAVRPRVEADTVSVEAALGDLGGALIGSEDDVRRALQWAGGAAEVVCWPTGDEVEGWLAPAGCRPLALALEGEPEDLATVAVICGHIGLAEDRAAAASWLEAVPHGRAVLPDGTVIARGLEVTPSHAVGELQAARRAAQAHHDLSLIRIRMAEAQARLDWARDQHQRQRESVDRAREALARAVSGAESRRQAEASLRTRLMELGERAAAVRQEQERDRSQLAKVKAELEELEHEQRRLEASRQAARSDLEAALALEHQLIAAEQEQRTSHERARLELVELEIRERERAQRARQQAEAKQRLLEREQAARSRVEGAESGVVVALALAEQAARELQALGEQEVQAPAERVDLAVEPLQELARLERRRAELESTLGQATEATQQLERELSGQRLRVEEARVRLGDMPMTEDRPPDDPARTAQEVARLEHRVEALGPVNELAPRQLAELLDKTEGMRAAHADTTAAREDIEAVRTHLQQLVEARLRTAMMRVTREFEDSWRELFGAGRATLLKVESGPDTGWGVEMEVQPQGKRVIPMAMLSGGERALTALALVLALQQVSPSPFYVFDEVDAALDEVNVANFARVLERRAQRSQFLVITHNLTTMARASQLYGVTQDGRGASRVLSVRLAEDGQSVRDRRGQELVEALVGG